MPWLVPQKSARARERRTSSSIVEVGRTYRERGNERQAAPIRRAFNPYGAGDAAPPGASREQTFDVFAADLRRLEARRFRAFLRGGRGGTAAPLA